jgi:hypothetical protein
MRHTVFSVYHRRQDGGGNDGREWTVRNLRPRQRDLEDKAEAEHLPRLQRLPGKRSSFLRNSPNRPLSLEMPPSYEGSSAVLSTRAGMGLAALSYLRPKIREFVALIWLGFNGFRKINKTPLVMNTFHAVANFPVLKSKPASLVSLLQPKVGGPKVDLPLQQS